MKTELTLGKELDTKDLNTPLLCVRSWKLADYLHLESLKEVATWALEDHLDAMVLLASNDVDIGLVEPIWFGHFVDAFREVCAHAVMETFQNMFITFLWVTRFKMLLPQTFEVLNKHPDVNNKLLKLLAWKEFEKVRTQWFPKSHSPYDVEHDIHNTKAITISDVQSCAECGKGIGPGQGPRFYNPFPILNIFGQHSKIGQLVWCKQCVDNFNHRRSWPWQCKPFGYSPVRAVPKTKMKAWAWSDDK